MFYTDIFLLLGSNLGDRVTNLKAAIKQIESFSKIIKQSSVYETAAWGKVDQPAFLNQSVQIESDVYAEELLNQCLLVEKKIGRIRSEKWEARIIDIDIIYFGKEIIELDNLIVPHPRLSERKFALIPICEIAPIFVHPVLKKSNQLMLSECTDTLEVKLFKG